MMEKEEEQKEEEEEKEEEEQKVKGKKGVVERNINDIVDRWIQRGIDVGGVKGGWCR